MTSPAPSALRSLQPSQNTAPVHEFACLYTHDLRRKQKRWQDGFLKFHTFNKRAMVYDPSRNHIGDTYWKESDTLQEGDELTLENGVIVEVAEPKSTTQTDLTPVILQKRPRDENGNVQSNPRLPVQGVRTNYIRPGTISQSLNRPLSAVLGTPKGRLGKAQLPQRSPFEERQANQAKDWAATERAAKRQRVAEVGQVWNAAKEARTPVPRSRVQPLCEQSATGRAAMAPPMLERQTPLAQRGRIRTAIPDDVIDITSDVEEPMSDVTLPNSPPNISHHALFPHGQKFQKPVPRPAQKVVVAMSESRASKGPQERPLARSPSPAVSTTSKVTGVQDATVAGGHALDDREVASDGQTRPPQRKTLKLRTGPRKKTLFCQEAPPQDLHVNAALSSRSVTRPNPADVRNSHGPKHVRRTSEIPKLDNGLTPSSPPEEVDATPETGGAEEHAGRYRQNSRSDRNPKSFSEREAQPSKGLARASTHGRMGQPVVNEVAPEAEARQAGGRKAAVPAAVADEATSPPHNRHVRSENESKSNQGKQTIAVRPSKLSRPTKKGAAPTLQLAAGRNMAVPPKTRRESTPPLPPVDKDVGPWSTEAMDLFDWRPPGYVFLGQGKGFAAAEAQSGDQLKT